jgi:hypothetical protein
MDHSFFSPSSAELEMLHKQVMQQIISPLAVLTKNRPDNPNTKNALQIATILNNKIQEAINNKPVIQDKATPSPSQSRSAAPAP